MLNGLAYQSGQALLKWTRTRKQEDWEEYWFKQQELNGLLSKTRVEEYDEMLERMIEELDKELQRLPRERGATRDEIEAAVKRISTYMGDRVKEAFQEAAKNAYMGGLDEVGKDLGRRISFGGVHEGALQAAIEGRGVAEAFADFSSNTSKRFNEIIRQAYKEGKVDVDSLVSQMIDEVGWQSRGSLETIARSETWKIYETARANAYEQQMEEDGEEYLFRFGTKNDLKTCDCCTEIMGETADGVPMEELKEIIVRISKKYFPSWNPTRDNNFPMPHPNCRHRHWRTFRDVSKEWTGPEIGPRGGYIWTHSETGEKRWQREKPTDRKRKKPEVPKPEVPKRPFIRTVDSRHKIDGFTEKVVQHPSGKHVWVVHSPETPQSAITNLENGIKGLHPALLEGNFSWIEVHTKRVGMSDYGPGAQTAGHYNGGSGVIRFFNPKENLGMPGGTISILAHEMTHSVHFLIRKHVNEEERKHSHDVNELMNSWIEENPAPSKEEYQATRGRIFEMKSKIRGEFEQPIREAHQAVQKLKDDYDAWEGEFYDFPQKERKEGEPRWYNPGREIPPGYYERGDALRNAIKGKKNAHTRIITKMQKALEEVDKTADPQRIWDMKYNEEKDNLTRGFQPSELTQAYLDWKKACDEEGGVSDYSKWFQRKRGYGREQYYNENLSEVSGDLHSDSEDKWHTNLMMRYHPKTLAAYKQLMGVFEKWSKQLKQSYSVEMN